MKTFELSTTVPSLPELLALAQSEPVLIRNESGEEFLLGAVDDFEHEVALLRSSTALRDLLEARRRETGRVSLEEIRARLG